MNGLYLGALGVPVGMVSGDDALAEELADWLPWAELVVVKRGVSRGAADSVHPSRARDLIRSASQKVVERAAAGRRALVSTATRCAAAHADRLRTCRPGGLRGDDPRLRARRRSRCRLQADDAITLYRAFVSAARLAASADE